MDFEENRGSFQKLKEKAQSLKTEASARLSHWQDKGKERADHRRYEQHLRKEARKAASEPKRRQQAEQKRAQRIRKEKEREEKRARDEEIRAEKAAVKAQKRADREKAQAEKAALAAQAKEAREAEEKEALSEEVQAEETPDQKAGKKKKKKKKRGPVRTFFVWLGRIVLILIGLIAVAAVVIWIRVQPYYNSAEKEVYNILSQMDNGTFKRETTTNVYDKDGTLLSKIGYENYRYVPIEDISSYIQDGYIDVEDKSFPSHHGVDYARTLKATFIYLKNRLTGGSEMTQGGSTITQQVIKNNLLSQEQTVERKVLEILLAQQIEKEFSKTQIMEFYCNSCYYGNGCYGVEGASQYYFGKSADSVDLAEAAILVGTSNSPNQNNPVADYSRAMDKKKMVLGQMLEENDITQKEYDAAVKEEPVIVKKVDKSDVDNYMVSMAVHDAALKLMELDGFQFQYTFDSEDAYKQYSDTYSKTYQETEEKIRSGGYEIYTSFNQDLQNQLQDAVDSSMSDEQDKNDDGSYKLQAAAAVIDNNTGMIVAAVGGRDAQGAYNRAFQAERQPGSSIKPLLDYGPALDNGVITPGSIYNDRQVTIAGYTPKNFGNEYYGKLPIREALARSLNTVAVQVFNDTGSETALGYLSRLKFSTLTYGDEYNTAIALGGFTRGVTVEDMVRGYATIENDGQMRDNTCVTKIDSEADGTVYEHKDTSEKVYSEDAAFMLRDMMTGVFQEDYGTGHSAKNDKEVYAGKSGTADGSKDAWFGGFSTYYTTVTWVGCDTPQEVKGLTGSSYPLTIWKTFMNGVHTDLAKKDFDVPSTIKLRNSKGDEKDVDYTTNVYESRPEGYDYFSTSLKAATEAHETKKKNDDAYKEAQDAVESFEDFQINSVSDAQSLDSKYQDVLDLIDAIPDTSRQTDLKERAEYKYSLLSGDVASTWQQKIKEQEQADAEQKKIDNANAADASLSQAQSDIAGIRYGIVQQYIAYFNSVTVYTGTVDSMITSAETALANCSGYSQYNSLASQLHAAENTAKSKPTQAEMEAAAAAAASEQAAAQASVSAAQQSDAAAAQAAQQAGQQQAAQQQAAQQAGTNAGTGAGN